MLDANHILGHIYQIIKFPSKRVACSKIGKKITTSKLKHLLLSFSLGSKRYNANFGKLSSIAGSPTSNSPIF